MNENLGPKPIALRNGQVRRKISAHSGIWRQIGANASWVRHPGRGLLNARTATAFYSKEKWR